MKSYHELVGERKALLQEVRRAELPALRAHWQGQLQVVEMRLAELKRVGKPPAIRTRNGDVFASGKWESLL